MGEMMSLFVSDQLTVQHQSQTHTTDALLPLQQGDHLSRTEFERRYAAMPHLHHAELIEGVVYMASPLRYELHARPHAQMNTWAGVYGAATPGVGIGDNATLRLDDENVVQPDVLVRLEPSAGGTSFVDTDGYISGVPELIIEIAASSASYDLYEKRDVYQRCGVREYLVWRVYDEQVDWWEQRDGMYCARPTDEHGIVQSRVFPGLWLHVPALLAGDMATVLAVVQQGIATPAHTTFAEQSGRITHEE